LAWEPLSDGSEEIGMAYIVVGLGTIIVGVLLFLASDSPATVERSEKFGFLLMAAGVVAVLIGMVAHVVAVTRADRRHP